MLVDFRRVILAIPHGKVSTYGAIAKAAGHPRAARQVAFALHSSHGLPWHRVVGAGGKISLPGHSGQEQRFRLGLEGVRFRGAKVDMEEFEHKFPGSRARKTNSKTAAKKKKIPGKR